MRPEPGGASPRAVKILERACALLDEARIGWCASCYNGEATVTAKPSLVAGIDIGSRSIECAAPGRPGGAWDSPPHHLRSPGPSAGLLDGSGAGQDWGPPAYGRKILLENLDHPEITAITRISGFTPWGPGACFRGAHHPGHRRQDTKAIALTVEGKVAKFENERPLRRGHREVPGVHGRGPAGVIGEIRRTSRFEADRRIQINSMCTGVCGERGHQPHGPGRKSTQYCHGAAPGHCLPHVGHAAPGGGDAVGTLRRRRGHNPCIKSPFGKKAWGNPSWFRPNPTWWAPWAQPFMEKNSLPRRKDRKWVVC